MENNLHSFDAVNLESDLHEFLNETNSKVVEVTNLWSLLVMKTRFSYQKEYGPKMNKLLMTQILIKEINGFMDQVNKFIRETLNIYSYKNESFELKKNLSFGSPTINLQLRKSLPIEYNTTLFRPLPDIVQIPIPYYRPDGDKYFDIECLDDIKNLTKMEVETDVTKSVNMKDTIFKTEELHMNEQSNTEHIITTLDEKTHRKRYTCDKCGRSWAYRKGVVYHKSKGKCSSEPRWIRWKSQGRPVCIHPDCENKEDIQYTYSGIMRHIITTHSCSETSVIAIDFSYTRGFFFQKSRICKN